MRTEVSSDGVPLVATRGERTCARALFVVVAAALVASMALAGLQYSAAAVQHATLEDLLAANEAERVEGAALVRNTCESHAYLVRDYCDRDATAFERCFELVERVEALVALGTRDAVFAALKSLEPQAGPVFVWSVDSATAAEDSHLDTTVDETVAYFNNTAYYYSREVHTRSVGCGGWSLGLWKTRPDATTGAVAVRSLQLAYCRSTATSAVRVCGGFDVRSDTT